MVVFWIGLLKLVLEVERVLLDCVAVVLVCVDGKYLPEHRASVPTSYIHSNAERKGTSAPALAQQARSVKTNAQPKPTSHFL